MRLSMGAIKACTCDYGTSNLDVWWRAEYTLSLPLAFRLTIVYCKGEMHKLVFHKRGAFELHVS
jgi:hypothetical protein